MMRFQDIWSGLRTHKPKPAYKPDPLIHSYRTVGTQFPILLGRDETEFWLSTGTPKGIDMPIRVGIASLTGNRDKNEDTGLVFLSQIASHKNVIPVCFAIIADGMGGHWGGEFASSIAAETLAECVINRIILPDISDKRPLPDEVTIRQIFTSAMTSAHEMVQFNVPGGGTTATCALIIGDMAYIAHVGDSRCGVINDRQLEWITRDHTYARVMEEQGQIPAGQGQLNPNRHILYRAIGAEADLEVDSHIEWLYPDSTLLLCSDGLWDALDETQITEIVTATGDPQQASERLVQAGLDASGSDNVTAVLIQMQPVRSSKIART